MKRVICLLLLAANVAMAAEKFQLPAFPVPALASSDMSSVRLLRAFHQAGLSGHEWLETADADYALLRSDSLTTLTAWLDATCLALNYDLSRARARNYDGTVFARLLEVAASLATLQGRHRALAIPIGILACQRVKAWGQLPGDGAKDVYVIFVTDNGMIVYDPPTRQMVALGDFPNKGRISQIRF